MAMKTINILSIDFDYFVEASNQDRAFFFPDGNDNLTESINNIVWADKYAINNNWVDRVKFKKNEYDYVLNILPDLLKIDTQYVVAESHKKIVELVNTYKRANIHIINLDFHHDMFIDHRYLDCGNWALFLKSNRQLDKLHWIRQELSPLPKGIKYKYTTSTNIHDIDLEGKKFDAVFLCKSSPWLPPHFDKYFIFMMNTIAEYVNGEISDDFSLQEDRMPSVLELAKQAKLNFKTLGELNGLFETAINKE